MKVAVVGSGISGLAAAYGLGAHHEVHLFEASNRLGGHANTVDARVDGRCLPVDTGFIVYNERTYPGFISLLNELNVKTQSTQMSFGVSCERSGIEWGSRGVRSLLARPKNLIHRGFRDMLRDLPRFNREARWLLDSDDSRLSLGQWLSARSYSKGFRDLYLRPIGAAIWSAAPKQFLDFPAASLARFLDNHQLLRTRGFLRWRTIVGGSRNYVRKLADKLRAEIHLNHKVRSVERGSFGIRLSSEQRSSVFDRVVLATHSDQALKLLVNPTSDEERVLSAIRYQANEAVLHTDQRLLPKASRAWSSWNYRIPAETRDRVLVTYDLTRLQSLPGPRRFLVTLNPDERIDPKQVLAYQRYDHPVFDAEANSAQARFDSIDGGGGVHFCGAYWRNGFHEDGFWSGIRVADSINRGS